MAEDTGENPANVVPSFVPVRSAGQDSSSNHRAAVSDRLAVVWAMRTEFMPITASAHRLIHRHIRGPHQRGEVASIARKYGDSRGNRELAAGQTASGERNCGEPIAKLQRHPFGTCRIGVTENDKEFLPAESYRRISGANHAGEHRAHAAQDEIARTVSAAIVDLLKPVEVEHQDRKRLTTAKTPRHFARADLAKPWAGRAEVTLA